MTPEAYPHPQPQAPRTRTGCTCAGPCFYCDTPLDGPHEHDHAPIPWRHGGRETVPTCQRCHSLKDRKRRFDTWPPAAQESAAAGLAGSAFWLMRFITDELQRPDGDPTVDRDTALAALAACTTIEARVALAHAVAFGLDVARDRKVVAA
jgi:hypothetical protein